MKNLLAYILIILALSANGQGTVNGLPVDKTIEVEVSTVVGPVGPIGPIGPIGPVGPVGPIGPEGPQGQQGVKGNQGNQGPVGPVGPVGPIGPEGDIGPQGIQGIQGLIGPVGPSGDEGAGFTNKGDWSAGQTYEPNDYVFSINAQNVLAPFLLKATTNHSSATPPLADPANWVEIVALQGPQGDEGAQGVQGPQGDSGAQGQQGVQGPEGPEGPEGPIGPQGPQGEQGVQGPQGVAGNTGATGPIGPQGNQGATGATGAPGLDGSVWHTAVGSPASNIGSVGDFYLDRSSTAGNGDVYRKTSSNFWTFRGNIRGDDGATGATGATGPAGDPASDDQTLSVNSSGANRTLSISGGNSVTLNVGDLDNSVTNELQDLDIASLVGNNLNLSLSSAGPTHSINLSKFDQWAVNSSHFIRQQNTSLQFAPKGVPIVGTFLTNPGIALGGNVVVGNSIEVNDETITRWLRLEPTGIPVCQNGRIYYSSGTHTFRGCANGSWVDLH